MQKSLFFLLILFTALGSFAQKPVALKKVLSLPLGGEDGSNGASVVWHPVQKKYYASFAGNSIFPFGVFDAKGKKLSDDSQEAMFDVRGLWYNPITKTIQANGYSDYGWGEYKLDKKVSPQKLQYCTKEKISPVIIRVVALMLQKKKCIF